MDLAPGPFPFRRRCSASLLTGCSRKVSVHRAPPQMPHCSLPTGWAPSQDCLSFPGPFSSLPILAVLSCLHSVPKPSWSELGLCLSAPHSLGIRDTVCEVSWLSSQILILKTIWGGYLTSKFPHLQNGANNTHLSGSCEK